MGCRQVQHQPERVPSAKLLWANDDVQAYLKELDQDKLRGYFAQGGKRFYTRYRCLRNGNYGTVMLEMMPATDYSADSQSVFLYVKVLEE